MDSLFITAVYFIVAAILLCYPISIKQVHPSIQIMICACLTTIGLSLAASYFFPDSTWTIYVAILLSLTNIVVPVLGAVVGLGTAAGLVTNAIMSQLLSQTAASIITTVSAVIGMVSLFLYRDLILHWQLIAPPVIGGYFAATAIGYTDETIFHSLWIVTALLSLAFHIRRRNVASWLERKQALAVHSKESQIVKVMRSADPKMSVTEYEGLKVKLLEAVDGDTEQVDRLVFGGGLY